MNIFRAGTDKDDEITSQRIEKSIAADIEYRKKKEDKLLNIYERPFLSQFCRIIFILEILIMVALTVAEINAYIRYDYVLGFNHFMTNVSITEIAGTGIFGIILIPLGFIGKNKNRKNYYRRIDYSPDGKNSEEYFRTEKAVKKLNRSLNIEIIISSAALLLSITVRLIVMNIM